MKRFVCMLLAALLLALCPAGFSEPAEDARRCVNLILEGNPSTGYVWQGVSSDETVALVEEEAASAQEETRVGAPAAAAFRIRGAAPGEAEITFSYSRPWESVQPPLGFSLAVTVDEGLNVVTGSRISLPQGESSHWDYALADGGVVELDGQDGEALAVRPRKDGTEEIKLSSQSGVFTYRVETAGDAVALSEIRYALEAPFNPEFRFTTTDLQGGEVTEQLFAGHSLTILNFWEPWCGPCVAEMPYLQQLSQEYADRGVQVVGVFATPDAEEDVWAVLDSTGAEYPILRYVADFGPLQTGFVPTTVIVDGTGAVVWGPTAGALNYAGWCALVEELL